MFYNLKISTMQEMCIKNKEAALCIIDFNNCPANIEAFDILTINSDNRQSPNLLVTAYLSEMFSSKEGLMDSCLFKEKLSEKAKSKYRTEIDSCFRNDEKLCVIWFQLFYDASVPKSNIALFAVTYLLYRSIQFLRHLPVKKKLFSYKLDNLSQKLFTIHRDSIYRGIRALRSEISINDYMSKLNEDADSLDENMSWFIDRENQSLFTLLSEYPDVDYINEFRLKRLCEIENQMRLIDLAYEKGKYKDMQRLAYNIHNVPEIIRILDDYRPVS